MGCSHCILIYLRPENLTGTDAHTLEIYVLMSDRRFVVFPGRLHDVSFSANKVKSTRRKKKKAISLDQLFANTRSASLCVAVCTKLLSRSSVLLNPHSLQQETASAGTEPWDRCAAHPQAQIEKEEVLGHKKLGSQWRAAWTPRHFFCSNVTARGSKWNVLGLHFILQIFPVGRALLLPLKSCLQLQQIK